MTEVQLTNISITYCSYHSVCVRVRWEHLRSTLRKSPVCDTAVLTITTMLSVRSLELIPLIMEVYTL